MPLAHRAGRVVGGHAEHQRDRGEIGAEIGAKRASGRGLDFLATELRDVPERQRSMRAVFDHSWNLLTERQRTLFAGAVRVPRRVHPAGCTGRDRGLAARVCEPWPISRWCSARRVPRLRSGQGAGTRCTSCCASTRRRSWSRPRTRAGHPRPAQRVLCGGPATLGGKSGEALAGKSDRGDRARAGQRARGMGLGGRTRRSGAAGPGGGGPGCLFCLGRAGRRGHDDASAGRGQAVTRSVRGARPASPQALRLLIRILALQVDLSTDDQANQPLARRSLDLLQRPELAVRTCAATGPMP